MQQAAAPDASGSWPLVFSLAAAHIPYREHEKGANERDLNYFGGLLCAAASCHGPGMLGSSAIHVPAPHAWHACLRTCPAAAEPPPDRARLPACTACSLHARLTALQSFLPLLPLCCFQMRCTPRTELATGPWQTSWLRSRRRVTTAPAARLLCLKLQLPPGRKECLARQQSGQTTWHSCRGCC